MRCRKSASSDNIWHKLAKNTTQAQKFGVVAQGKIWPAACALSGVDTIDARRGILRQNAQDPGHKRFKFLNSISVRNENDQPDG